MSSYLGAHFLVRFLIRYSYCCFSFVFSGNLHLRHLPTHNSRELLRKYSKINWIWVWLLNCKNTNKGLTFSCLSAMVVRLPAETNNPALDIKAADSSWLWILTLNPKKYLWHITDQINKRDSKLNAFHFFSRCKLGITDINLMLWTVLWLFYEWTMCNVNLTEWEKGKHYVIVKLESSLSVRMRSAVLIPPPRPASLHKSCLCSNSTYIRTVENARPVPIHHWDLHAIYRKYSNFSSRRIPTNNGCPDLDCSDKKNYRVLLPSAYVVCNNFSQVCLSVCLSVCLCVCLSICLCVCSDDNFWTAEGRNFIFSTHIHLYNI